MNSISNIIEYTIGLLNDTSKTNVYTNINRFYRIDKNVINHKKQQPYNY
ncbi:MULTISPECIES: hypothetical protein [Flavobacteriaceae]|jgi:hypothetical protein|uniref:Uncharacterized protein n=1 Tax=Lutibacter litoralis TaxID=321268 RepID=A0ABV5JZH7_9FLAO|nr:MULTISPECIES: hypothetical protein [Flavobacteriaceae]GGK53581.1 hypothetical protein GCM10007963_22360 [Lutibacter litoralis]